MFDNEIIKPGERLKRIREMYNITQDEITLGICSRTNLSKIENNNQKLSLNLAVGFANRFNKIIGEKGVAIKSITADFLIKDEDEQANSIFINIVNELKKIEAINFFEQKLFKAENIIKKYKIRDSNKIELYKLSADFYYNKYQYSKSNEMCSNGLKICINSNNVKEEVNLYILKSKNNIKILNYNEALKDLDYAERLNNDTYNWELSELILYNKGLTYKKMCKYDNALEYLKVLIEKPVKNKNLLIKAKMVYANCLTEKNTCFEEARKEYLEILDLAHDDKDLTALAYKNLSELHYNEKKYKEAAKYIKYAIIYTPSNEYLNEIYYFAAKIYQKLDEYFEDYLLCALEICEEKDRENFKLIEKIIYELVLFYIKKQDETNIMLMIKKTRELNIDYNLVYLEIIQHYICQKNEKSMDLLTELKSKIKEIKEI